MSVRIMNEVRALHKRMDELELKFNKINTEPRTVAGMPCPDPEPHAKKAMDERREANKEAKRRGRPPKKAVNE